MAERSVSAFNREYRFPHLLVFADRNRVEREETFEIPAAARDRFLMEIDHRARRRATQVAQLMFDARFHDTDRADRRAAAGDARLPRAERRRRGDPAQRAPPPRRCSATSIDLWRATAAPARIRRAHLRRLDMSQLMLAGASPRGMSMLLRAARVTAWLDGHAPTSTPEDVQSVFVETMAHRAVLPAGLRAAPRRDLRPADERHPAAGRRALTGVRSGPCNARRCRSSTTASPRRRAAAFRAITAASAARAASSSAATPRCSTHPIRAGSICTPACATRSATGSCASTASARRSRSRWWPTCRPRWASKARGASSTCWPTSPRASPGRRGAPATASASSAATRRCATICCSRRRARAPPAACSRGRCAGCGSRVVRRGGCSWRTGISPGSVRWCSWSRTSICRWPRSSGAGELRACTSWCPSCSGIRSSSSSRRRAGWRRCATPKAGRRRLVWWRPALREKWAAHHRECREALLRVFRAHRLRPLFVEGAFSAEAVTRHFHS